MAVNKILNYFIQFDRFNKLSPCERVTVGFLSALPALTIVGIIASPFIWRGMTRALSKERVQKEVSNSKVESVAKPLQPKKKAEEGLGAKSSTSSREPTSRQESTRSEKRPATVSKSLKEDSSSSSSLKKTKSQKKIITPSCFFKGEWKDPEGLKFQRLQSFLAVLNKDQIEELLKELFDVDKPSQEIFDGMFVALTSSEDPQMAELFTSIVLKLQRDGKLKFLNQILCWHGNYASSERAAMTCNFVATILKIAISQESQEVRENIINTLVISAFPDYVIRRAIEGDGQVQGMNLQEFPVVYRERFYEWVESLRNEDLRERLLRHLSDDFNSCSSDKALYLFREAQKTGAEHLLLKPEPIPNRHSVFANNYSYVISKLSIEEIDALFAKDEDFFVLNKFKCPLRELEVVFPHELADKQLELILKNYKKKGNLPPRVVHNYILIQHKSKNEENKFNIIIEQLSIVSLCDYVSTLEKNSFAFEGGAFDADKRFMEYFLLKILNQENYHVRLNILKRFCPNILKILSEALFYDFAPRTSLERERFEEWMREASPKTN